MRCLTNPAVPYLELELVLVLFDATSFHSRHNIIVKLIKGILNIVGLEKVKFEPFLQID